MTFIGRVLNSSGSSKYRSILSGNDEQTGVVWKRIGTLNWDASIGSSVVFYAAIESGNSSYNTYVQLYDIVTMSYVTNSLLQTTSTIPDLKSVTLNTGSDLYNGQRTYELHLKSENSNTDARCLGCWIG